jgi:hypothetical protein
MKKTYVRPQLNKLGSVRELTMGRSNGRKLDQTFPVGTDFGALTFS